MSESSNPTAGKSLIKSLYLVSTSAMGVENKRSLSKPHEAALPNIQKRRGPDRLHDLPKVTQFKVEKLRFEARTQQLPGTEKEDEIQTLRRQARNT